MRSSPLRSDPEKTLDWLRRSRRPIARKTRLNPLNGERRARARGDRIYGPYHRYVASLGTCILADHPDHECIGETTGHHLKTIAAGGEDEGNEIDVCALAHASIHTLGTRLFS